MKFEQPTTNNNIPEDPVKAADIHAQKLDDAIKKLKHKRTYEKIPRKTLSAKLGKKGQAAVAAASLSAAAAGFMIGQSLKSEEGPKIPQKSTLKAPKTPEKAPETATPYEHVGPQFVPEGSKVELTPTIEKEVKPADLPDVEFSLEKSAEVPRPIPEAQSKSVSEDVVTFPDTVIPEPEMVWPKPTASEQDISKQKELNERKARELENQERRGAEVRGILERGFDARKWGVTPSVRESQKVAPQIEQKSIKAQTEVKEREIQLSETSRFFTELIDMATSNTQKINVPGNPAQTIQNARAYLDTYTSAYVTNAHKVLGNGGLLGFGYVGASKEDAKIIAEKGEELKRILFGVCDTYHLENFKNGIENKIDKKIERAEDTVTHVQKLEDEAKEKAEKEKQKREKRIREMEQGEKRNSLENTIDFLKGRRYD